LDALLLARWQFGLTAAVHHFLFVPLTIGLALLTAILQTVWLRTGRERHLRATKFWGGLFLINFVLGVATGIVREFQFGMAWNGGHSRIVGGDLGAPPAIAGLLGFFLESTVLGLWILGWDRLPRGLHTACGWIAACGIALSAYPVLTADAPLRHPVGHTKDTGRHVARLAVTRAMHGGSTALTTFAHTMIAALLVSGLLLVAVSAWHLRHGRHRDTMLPSLRLGLCAMSIGGVGFGWILTETSGRRRVISGLLMNKSSNLPSVPSVPSVPSISSVSAGGMWTSLIVLSLLYTLLAVVEVWLMVRAARRGPDDPNAGAGATEGGAAEPLLGFAC
jgi:cytochrome d ubiquinol oxidase subunit I